MKRIAAKIGMVPIGVLFCVVTGVTQDAGSVVTVTGCLMQMSTSDTVLGGSTSDALTAPAEPINPPSTASPADEERFVLANARATGGTSVQRYLVAGLRRDDLRKQINHQVELSGRVWLPDPSTTQTPSASATFADLPRLDATSLRPIAEACSPPGSDD